MKQVRDDDLGGARGAPRLRRGPTEMAALKREMLERARRIYREEGVEALSMRRLAQELGISTMAIYSYFESKKALLDGLWIEVFESLTDELLDASKGQRGARRVLEAHVRCFMDFWERHPEQFRMIYMSSTQTASLDEIGQSQMPVYNRLLGLVRERLAACAPAGVEPDERRIRLLCDLMSVRQMGYLMMVVGLPRYPVLDRELLRERTVQGVLRDVAEEYAGESGPAAPEAAPGSPGAAVGG
ncbi:TetR/AcrR family transcriptional regulator [Roseateles sp.]|uniref:TetR/AcrR family transcriptional regulator n=1 Tax=Roseateles sp. TaxID=1971397 RepID=UPI0031DF0946